MGENRGCCVDVTRALYGAPILEEKKAGQSSVVHNQIVVLLEWLSMCKLQLSTKAERLRKTRSKEEAM